MGMIWGFFQEFHPNPKAKLYLMTFNESQKLEQQLLR